MIDDRMWHVARRYGVWFGIVHDTLPCDWLDGIA